MHNERQCAASRDSVGLLGVCRTDCLKGTCVLTQAVRRREAQMKIGGNHRRITDASVWSDWLRAGSGAEKIAVLANMGAFGSICLDDGADLKVWGRL